MVPHNVYDLVKAIPHEAHQMDVLRTAVSGLGATEGGISSEEQKLSIIAQMPALVANCYRINKGMEPAEPDPSLNLSANFLYMLSGKKPSSFEAWCFERMLILYLEHDLNASAFTVRVVASTLADIYSACTAGLAALKGPLHGGANEAAMQMLLKIGKAENARSYVQESLAKREKIMGFGHRVYKTVDPRSQLSEEAAEGAPREGREGARDLQALRGSGERRLGVQEAPRERRLLRCTHLHEPRHPAWRPTPRYSRRAG